MALCEAELKDKTQKFHCLKFWGFAEKECSPGRYLDCKEDCSQKECAINRNQHTKQGETIPLQKKEKKFLSDEDFFSWDTSYCLAFGEKKGKRTCRPRLFLFCDSECLQSKNSFKAESIKKALSDILKVTELNKKTISQLEECYWIIIADEKSRSSKINTALKDVKDNSIAFADSLKNLDNNSMYYLEKELWKQEKIPIELKMTLNNLRNNNLDEEHLREQSGGLNPCPECGKEFKNLQEHIRKRHPDRVGQIINTPATDSIDLIERTLSDTCRICNAADKALSKLMEVKDKGGRPRNTALKECVSKLSIIFVETTGKQPKSSYDKRSKTYKGHFLEFTQTFLSIVLNNPPSNSAIGQIIKIVHNIQKNPIPSQDPSSNNH
jgi:hypothetical protein